MKVLPLRYGTSFRKVFREREVFNQLARDASGVEVEVGAVRDELRGRGRPGVIESIAGLGGDDLARRLRVELWLLRDLRSEELADRAHATAYSDRGADDAKVHDRPQILTIAVIVTVPGCKPPRYSVAELVRGEPVDLPVIAPARRDRIVLLNPLVIDERTPPSLRPWLALLADMENREVDEERYPAPTFQRLLQLASRERAPLWELEAILDESLWEGELAGQHRRGYARGLRRGVVESLEAQGFRVDASVRAWLKRASDEEVRSLAAALAMRRSERGS